MSRFVRASKYRHVYGQPAKKENCLENIKVSNSAWDTNMIASSGKYLSINWNASGGGAFAILPAPTPLTGAGDFPTKLPDVIPLARSHTAPVLDTDWSPHADNTVASAGEDGKVLVWQVSADTFEGWGSEGWVPRDFDPVLRIDASPRKVGQVLWHPTAKHVLASAQGDHTVKLWDLGAPESAKAVLSGHSDAVQSIAFNPTGQLLVTTSRDRKIRIFDARAGGEAVRVADGHGGIKGARVVWMGDKDRIATTGFSRMSDRQVSIWETGGLSNVKSLALDQSAGVIMPFWSDNNILFLAGKGDGNIRYYEYEKDNLYALDEHKSSDPQRGMCFIPRRALVTSECEIARAYKLTAAGGVEGIAFIVPRKADSFQADIFPPAPSIEPSLTAGEFFAGKVAPPKLVSLEDGAVSSAPATSVAIPTAVSAPAPTRTQTAPPPQPSPVSTPVTPAPQIVKVASEPIPTPEPPAVTVSPVAEFKAPSRSQSTNIAIDSKADELQEENDKLAAELREARTLIRNLELQVESLKANAKKAAEALLNH
ncbi:microtubule binding protein [Auriscalpium vulgare]|uniref:Microtubule binding protein n=1 Tax=Auriscalpium vulgare TaxID=40419 RepID=A0ACB8RDS3_9AGAM|nr:microtubule binding protein [Auriscalpium vulgare]